LYGAALVGHRLVRIFEPGSIAMKTHFGISNSGVDMKTQQKSEQANDFAGPQQLDSGIHA
jgi:hypothetical protein